MGRPAYMRKSTNARGRKKKGGVEPTDICREEKSGWDTGNDREIGLIKQFNEGTGQGSMSRQRRTRGERIRTGKERGRIILEFRLKEKQPGGGNSKLKTLRSKSKRGTCCGKKSGEAAGHTDLRNLVPSACRHFRKVAKC